MVVTCSIEFDNNPDGTYFAGQVVTGRITLQSDKAKQVKAMLLKINGFAHTSWSESSSRSTTDAHGRSTTTSDTTWYSGHEDYIASLTYLLGSDDNISSVIEPGIHTYNFACHLPTTCPSSFEGLYGHIRYTVKVALVRPWKFDQTFTKGFTVLKIMDLNYDSPLLRMSCDSEVEKTYCCGPCKSDPLKINVNLPQSGYVPGQQIPVNILVTNDSNIPVDEMRVELILQAIYYSQRPYSKSRDESIVVSKLEGDPVLRHCKKLFNYMIPVPATPPSCFNLCRILQVAYQIKVEAKVKGCHANQVIVVPVTIGNVPLTVAAIQQQQPAGNVYFQRNLMATAATGETMEAPPFTMSMANQKHAEGMMGSFDVHTVRTMEENNNQSTFMDEQRGPPSPWAADASIPPPSYQEAVHLKTAKINADEEHDYGQCDFTPRYPVFNIPSPTAPPLPPTTFAQFQFENGEAANDNADTSADKSTWL